jgi:hypothetical protein
MVQTRGDERTAPGRLADEVCCNYAVEDVDEYCCVAFRYVL